MEKRPRKLFRYGCFAVVGMIVLLVLISGLLTVMALHNVRSEKIEERVLSRTVPASESPPEDSGPSERSEPQQTAPQRLETESNPLPGQVILDLSQGEFDIRPASPGEPLRVEATYDINGYDLQESLETGEASGWIYRLSFKQTSFRLITPFALLLGGSRPKVRVYLPMDVPYSLHLRLSEGGSSVDLGGLWLTSAVIHFAKGGSTLAIRKPLRYPMEHLSIRSAMGGFSTAYLGNGSPRDLDIVHRMGGMNLDLRGAWVQDGAISIDSSMGGGAVRLPRGVKIEGIDFTPSVLSGKTGSEKPTLTISMSHWMGNVEIYD